ncbi:MAG: hypothetical protein V4507_05775 [Verrucomicrobiota bacterium]
MIGTAGAGLTEISAGNSLGSVSIQLSGDTRNSTLTLSALQYATIDFFGGQGSTVLKAGASYNTAWGQSRLQGGDSVGTLDAHLLTQGIDLIAGKGNTVIKGGSGADKIVSNRGSDLMIGGGGADQFYFLNDFGRDRIFVTGTGSSVSFGGATISGGGLVADYVIPKATDKLKFQFGPLVESVKSGSNTVFFATSPSGANSIDTWTGGSGGDTFNVFYFAPGKTLSLVGGSGANLYSVFLGDPKKVYNKDAALNIGNISINDSASSSGRLLLTQTFADTISYDSTQVTNGRERMQLTGLERIDLDAGDSTVIWGDVTNPNTYTSIIGGNLTTGRIIMVGNVNLTGTADVVLNLARTFNVAYNLNVQNANSTDSRNLKINIENPNPQLSSDLYLGTSKNITLSQGPGTGGDGYGIISLNLPTGSIDNAPSSEGGMIRADNGSIEMRVRNSIGQTGGGTKSVQVRSASISASTSSEANFSGLQGIYLYSPTDLNIRASQYLDGITTANGQIRLETAAGRKITYGDIIAGGGRDITIVTDKLELSGAYSISRTTTSKQMVSLPVTNYVSQYVWTPYTYGFYLPPFLYPSTIWIYELKQVPVVSYVQQLQDVTTTQTINYAAGSGKIHGTGNLIILNKSDLQNIEVGKLTASASSTTLSLTQAILDSWKNATVNGVAYQFGSIVIGRDHADSVHTGHIDLFNYAYENNLLVRAATIKAGGSPGAPDPAVLSSTGSMELDAYKINNTSLLNGSITFDTALDLRAQTILINADNDITTQGKFTSTASLDGLIQIKTGVFSGAGSITLGGQFTATGAGSNLSVETGATSGNIAVNVSSLNVENLVILNAVAGSISHTGTNRLTTDDLEVYAAGNISLKTRITQLVKGQITGSGSLTIDEYDSLNVSEAIAASGSITIQAGTVAGASGTGDLFLHTVNASGTVTLNSIGNIEEFSANPIAAGEWHVTANQLVAQTLGDITLLTKVNSIDVQSLSTGINQGNITLDNTTAAGTPLVITRARANNGQIDIHSSQAITATSITSNAGTGITDVNNTISLSAGSDINVGTITTGGYADIFLTSDGRILKVSTGTPLVTGRDLFAVANGNAGAGNPAINLNTVLREINAETTNFGDVRFFNTGSTIVRNIETFAGNVYVDLNSTLPSSQLTIDTIVSGAKDIYLNAPTIKTQTADITASSAIAGTFDNNVPTAITLTANSNGGLTVSGVAPIIGQLVLLSNQTEARENGLYRVTATGDSLTPWVLTRLASKISGNLLTTTSVSNTTLDTVVNSLYSTITGSGILVVTETDSLDVLNAVTNSGTITITTGQFGVAATDGVGALPHLLASGNLNAGLIKAGATGNANAFLTTYGGGLFKLTGATGPQLIANEVTATTASGVGIGNPNIIGGSTPLETQIRSLIATTSQSGNINISEVDDITLTRLDVVAGSIFVNAGGSVTATNVKSNDPINPSNIEIIAADDIQLNQLQTDAGVTGIVRLTATGGLIDHITGRIISDKLIAQALSGIGMLTDVNFLTTDITGTAGDTIVNELNSLAVTHAFTADGLFKIIAGDRIEADTTTTLPSPHIEATTLELITTLGIASRSNYLNVNVDTIVNAEASVSGGIFIHSFKDIVLNRIQTYDGAIGISSDGGIQADELTTYIDKSENSIYLTTFNGSNITVNFISAGNEKGVATVNPPDAADIIITSDGMINSLNPLSRLQPVNLIGDEIIMKAQTGVGNVFEVLSTFRTIFNSSVTGGAKMINYTETPLVLNEFVSQTGDVTFTQIGGGNLTINTVHTGSGDATVKIEDGGNLTLSSIGSDNGGVNITVADGGELYIGSSFTPRGGVTITADHIEFTGGASALQGSGDLVINTASATQKVRIGSPFATNSRPDTIDITLQDLLKLSLSFHDLFIGNPFDAGLNLATLPSYDSSSSSNNSESNSSEGSSSASNAKANSNITSDSSSEEKTTSTSSSTPTPANNVMALSDMLQNTPRMGAGSFTSPTYTQSSNSGSKSGDSGSHEEDGNSGFESENYDSEALPSESSEGHEAQNAEVPANATALVNPADQYVARMGEVKAQKRNIAWHTTAMAFSSVIITIKLATRTAKRAGGKVKRGLARSLKMF